MRELRQVAPSLMLLALAAGGIFASAGLAHGQSVLERTPNLAAGWTGTEGTVYFNFLHRFWTVGGKDVEDKVLNSPTFFLAVPLPGRTLLGVDYATWSLVDGTEFNEIELFARWTPVSTAAGHPIDLSFTGAYNEAASSGDAEVSVSVPAGPVKLIAVGRFLSDVYDDGLDESKWAIGGGATIRFSDNVALAGDVVALTDREVGQDAAGVVVLDVAWSAALQLAVPYTPHTFSLQVTNARTASLQGSSFGDVDGGGKGQTRYGFEFTIPFTLSRYFGGRQRSAQQGPSGEVAAEVTLTNQLRYEPAAVTISAGQAVRWRNTSALIHTVTADPSRAMQAANVRLPAGAAAFDSGDMAPGESFTWTFTEPGEYRYICIPHEGAAMTGTIMVR